MTEPARVMLVIGTRPEAIKMCPLVPALRVTPNLVPLVVSTGQHTSMLDEVLHLFGVTPDLQLGVHRPRQTLADVTARCLNGLAHIIDAHRPAAVVVQGDTATTLAGALAGFYAKVPVVHLEAGLRSDDPRQPFPEEANRRMVTTISDLHLAATPANRDRLLTEGVAASAITVVGNTVIDALLHATSWRHPWTAPPLRVLDTDHRPVLLVTAHRRENWGTPLRGIAETLADLAARRPDLLLVWPMHANPAVQATIRPAFTGVSNVVLTGPVNYADFTRLLQRASLVLTDSGGIQEEAPALGKPVLVLRDVTERSEAVQAGAARLIGTSPGRIRAEIEMALDRPARPAQSPYGDGHAATRAAAAIQALLGLGDRRSEFKPATTAAILHPVFLRERVSELIGAIL